MLGCRGDAMAAPCHLPDLPKPDVSAGVPGRGQAMAPGGQRSIIAANGAPAMSSTAVTSEAMPARVRLFTVEELATMTAMSVAYWRREIRLKRIAVIPWSGAPSASAKATSTPIWPAAGGPSGSALKHQKIRNFRRLSG